MAALGKNQQSALRALDRIGQWPGGGWTWDNASTTERLLKSLVERGLVDHEPGVPKTHHRGKKLAFPLPAGRGTYRINDAGRAVLA